MTKRKRKGPALKRLRRQAVEVDFDGGTLTSDGGLVLLEKSTDGDSWSSSCNESFNRFDGSGGGGGSGSGSGSSTPPPAGDNTRRTEAGPITWDPGAGGGGTG